MSKNLIKANQFILKEQEPIVVDVSGLLAKRVAVSPASTEERTFSEGFQTGLNAPEIDPELYIMEEEQLESEELSVASVYTGPTPEELVAEARVQVDAMYAEAEQSIAILREKAMEDGRHAGYEQGKIEAMQELEKEKAALQQKAVQLEREYQQLIDRLEPEFIETLTGIYEQIFQVELSGHRTILSHAISNCIRRVEGGQDFLIHVSRADYPAVLENKQLIMASLMSPNVSLEIVEDAVLKTSECMIETNSGIYDCGIGTQLEELKKKLQLLSYEK